MCFKELIIKNTQCNIALNRKILCLKRSWDEVSKLLDNMCSSCSCKKKKHHK